MDSAMNSIDSLDSQLSTITDPGYQKGDPLTQPQVTRVFDSVDARMRYQLQQNINACASQQDKATASDKANQVVSDAVGWLKSVVTFERKPWK